MVTKKPPYTPIKHALKSINIRYPGKPVTVSLAKLIAENRIIDVLKHKYPNVEEPGCVQFIPKLKGIGGNRFGRYFPDKHVQEQFILTKHATKYIADVQHEIRVQDAFASLGKSELLNDRSLVVLHNVTKETIWHPKLKKAWNSNFDLIVCDERYGVFICKITNEQYKILSEEPYNECNMKTELKGQEKCHRLLSEVQEFYGKKIPIHTVLICSSQRDKSRIVENELKRNDQNYKFVMELNLEEDFTEIWGEVLGNLNPIASSTREVILGFASVLYAIQHTVPGKLHHPLQKKKPCKQVKNALQTIKIRYPSGQPDADLVPLTDLITENRIADVLKQQYPGISSSNHGLYFLNESVQRQYILDKHTTNKAGVYHEIRVHDAFASLNNSDLLNDRMVFVLHNITNETIRLAKLKKVWTNEFDLIVCDEHYGVFICKITHKQYIEKNNVCNMESEFARQEKRYSLLSEVREFYGSQSKEQVLPRSSNCTTLTDCTYLPIHTVLICNSRRNKSRVEEDKRNGQSEYNFVIELDLREDFSKIWRKTLAYLNPVASPIREDILGFAAVLSAIQSTVPRIRPPGNAEIAGLCVNLPLQQVAVYLPYVSWYNTISNAGNRILSRMYFILKKSYYTVRYYSSHTYHWATQKSWNAVLHYDKDADSNDPTTKQEYTNEQVRTSLTEELTQLRDNLGESVNITDVYVNKTPLENVPLGVQLTSVDYHAFVVFMTPSFSWSLEKNTQGIFLSRSKTKGKSTAVINKFCSRKRKQPIELLQKDKGGKTLNDLIKLIGEKNFVDEGYNVFHNNSQHFARTIFDKVANKKSWRYTTPVESMSPIESKQNASIWITGIILLCAIVCPIESMSKWTWAFSLVVILLSWNFITPVVGIIAKILFVLRTITNSIYDWATKKSLYYDKNAHSDSPPTKQEYTNEQVQTSLREYELRRSLGVSVNIIKVYVYKTPIEVLQSQSPNIVEKMFEGRQCTLKNYLYHAFVVFKTDDGFWWSLEKNTEGIFLSQPIIKGKDTVKNMFRNCKRKKPIELLVEDKGAKTTDDLMELIVENNFVSEGYDAHHNNSQHFARTIFNKVARNKSWNFTTPVEGIVSKILLDLRLITKSIHGWATKKSWKAVLYYDKDADSNDLTTIEKYTNEQVQSSLRQELCGRLGESVHISDVYVYTAPLEAFNVRQCTLVDYHAFVVFKTDTLWWSLEKNRAGIYLCQSISEDTVRSKFCTHSRQVPVRVEKDDHGAKTLDNLIELIGERNFVNEGYHVIDNNCQHFARIIFDKVARNMSWNVLTLTEYVSPVSGRSSGMLIAWVVLVLLSVVGLLRILSPY